MQPWLDLRRLRYFQAIAEAGSFSAASRALLVAQPALSHHIRELEQDFGGCLFERSRSGVRLTEAGQLLLDRARRILAEVAEAETALRRLRARQLAATQTIRIAMIPSLAPTLTPLLLAEAARLFPKGALHIIEAGTQDSHELILAGRIDFAVDLADDRWPEGEPLVWEELLFVSAPGPGAVPGRPIRFAELALQPLVLPSPGKPVRQFVQKIADRLGLPLTVAFEIDGLNPRKQTVIAGLAATLLPIVNIAEERAAGVLIARPVIEPETFRLIVLEGRAGVDKALAGALRDLLVPLLERITREVRADLKPALARSS